MISLDIPSYTTSVSTIHDTTRVRDTDPPIEKKINPLSTVSGSSNIRDSDLTCTALNGGFPSVGCRGFPVFNGKWYFELKVETAGCVQVGWVDSGYDGGADVGEGVGDDIHSWAYDGWRMYLWHEASSEWGAKWSPGDIIGCALNMNDKSMSFYLNGLGEEIDMGLAFTNMNYSGGLYPCASFNKGEIIQFNFGSRPFAYSPPIGYLPYARHIHSAMKINKKIMKKFPKSLRPLVSFSRVLNIDENEEFGRDPRSVEADTDSNNQIMNLEEGEEEEDEEEEEVEEGREGGKVKGKDDKQKRKERRIENGGGNRNGNRNGDDDSDDNSEDDGSRSDAFFFEDALEEVKGKLLLFYQIILYFLLYSILFFYTLFYSDFSYIFLPYYILLHYTVFSLIVFYFAVLHFTVLYSIVFSLFYII